MEKNRPILEHLIGPAVVGLVVLVGQFFLHPLTAAIEARQSDLLERKQTTYLEALDLVDKFYGSLSWKDQAGNPMNSNRGPKPTREDVNHCLSRLLLVQDDDAIAQKFLQCFGHGEKSQVSPIFKNELVNLMRKDLFRTKAATSPMPFYFTLDNTDDTGPYTAN